MSTVVLKNDTDVAIDDVPLFRTCILNAPELISPQDKQEVGIPWGGIDVTVRWQAVFEAEFYVLQVSLNSDFRGPTTKGYKIPSLSSSSESSDAGLEHTFTWGEDLYPEKDMYWRVFAYDEEGCASESSETWSFKLIYLKTPGTEYSSEGPDSDFSSGGGFSSGDSDSENLCESCRFIQTQLSTEKTTLNRKKDTGGTLTAIIDFPSSCGTPEILWFIGAGNPTGPFDLQNPNDIRTCGFEITRQTELGTYFIEYQASFGGGWITCTEILEIEVVDGGIEDSSSGAESGGEPPPPESSGGGGQPTGDRLDGEWDFAIIVGEQDDCYLVEKLTIEFRNGIAFQG